VTTKEVAAQVIEQLRGTPFVLALLTINIIVLAGFDGNLPGPGQRQLLPAHRRNVDAAVVGLALEMIGGRAGFDRRELLRIKGADFDAALLAARRLVAIPEVEVRRARRDFNVEALALGIEELRALGDLLPADVGVDIDAGCDLGGGGGAALAQGLDRGGDRGNVSHGF
jgi:hypothetical protein